MFLLYPRSLFHVVIAVIQSADWLPWRREALPRAHSSVTPPTSSLTSRQFFLVLLLKQCNRDKTTHEGFLVDNKWSNGRCRFSPMKLAHYWQSRSGKWWMAISTWNTAGGLMCWLTFHMVAIFTSQNFSPWYCWPIHDLAKIKLAKVASVFSTWRGWKIDNFKQTTNNFA